MMRKLVILLILLGVFYTSCPNPTDIQGFIEDEKIKELIDDGKEEKDPEDPIPIGTPELEWYYIDDPETTETLDKGDTLTILLEEIIIVKITNSEDYSKIEWFGSKDSGTPLTTGDTFTIDTTDSALYGDFDKIGTYPMSVMATLEEGGKTTSTLFTIKVIEVID